jgi:hypothetical protein
LQDRHDDQYAELNLAIRNSIAGLLKDLGRFDEAIELYRSNLVLAVGLYGTGGQFTLIAADNLAEAQLDQGDLQAAVTSRREIVDRMSQYFGRLDEHTLIAIHNLARAYLIAEDYEAALRLSELVMVDGYGRMDIQHYIPAADLVGSVYLAIGQSRESFRLRIALVGLSYAILGKNDPTTKTVRDNLYVSYRLAARSRSAVASIRVSRAYIRAIRFTNRSAGAWQDFLQSISQGQVEGMLAQADPGVPQS